MIKLFAAAFAAGLAVLAWIAAGFAGSSWIALLMTAVIAAVYLFGANELRQFRATTQSLRAALDPLDTTPPTLAQWLERVPPSLRDAVRLRVEGERASLPGPALAPFLVGLLVMLGMLGTFFGMIVTFQGAVFALEGSTDLQAIRAALAAPIKGLGLSFGTSVAGVAASAMLGLMAAIARRERVEAARLLDRRIAGALRPFSLAHQRHETLGAVQLQSRALPELVQRLDTLMERMEQRSAQLDAQLLDRHAQLQREVTGAYAGLAEAVGRSLHDSLSAGARAAGDALRPVAEGTMAQLAAESRQLHERLGETARAQAAALSQQFADAFAQAQALHAQSEQQHAQRMEQLEAAWRDELAGLRSEEEARGAAAVERLGELQAAVTQHLATLGAALEAPLTRLLQTAAEVPEAAAGVITQLRAEMGRIAERDNLALQERSTLLERLGTLLETIEQGSVQQRQSTQALVDSAASVLQQAGERFAQSLEAQAGQAAETATHVAAGAVELASVAEAFGAGVQAFQASNDKLVEGLERMEASLRKSTARSDEQLAYYVAQAREVIDLSIASQQGVVESLRQLQAKPAVKLPVLAVEGQAA